MFNGTWNEVSKTNIEEILKKMGYNWAVRKVAIAMGMTLVIKGLLPLSRTLKPLIGSLIRDWTSGSLVRTSGPEFLVRTLRRVKKIVKKSSISLGIFVPKLLPFSNSQNRLKNLDFEIRSQKNRSYINLWGRKILPALLKLKNLKFSNTFFQSIPDSGEW